MNCEVFTISREDDQLLVKGHGLIDYFTEESILLFFKNIGVNVGIFSDAFETLRSSEMATAVVVDYKLYIRREA